MSIIKMLAKSFVNIFNTTGNVKNTVQDIVDNAKSDFKAEAVIAMLEAKRAELDKAKPALRANIKELSNAMIKQSKQINIQLDRVELLQCELTDTRNKLENYQSTSSSTELAIVSQPINNTITTIDNRIKLATDRFIPTIKARISKMEERRDKEVMQLRNIGNVMSGIDTNIAYLRDLNEFNKFNDSFDDTDYYADAIALDQQITEIVATALNNQHIDDILDEIENGNSVKL